MQILNSLFKTTSISGDSFSHLETNELAHLPNQCVYPQAKNSGPNLVNGGIQEPGHKDFVYQWRGIVKGKSKPSLGSVSVTNIDKQSHFFRRTKKGHYYYGGPIFNHFGHFLAECIHRLMYFKWLSSELEIEKVIFIPQRYNGLRTPSLPPHFYNVLEYLGIPKNKILLIQKPTTFESLWVAKQQSYFRVHKPISQDYLSFLTAQASNCLNVSPNTALEKVYVSRSNYLLRGGYAGEKYIESILEQNGFTTYFPEKHELNHQLRVYSQAKEIIFSEGSAIHVLELLGKIDAKVGVIRRRRNGRVAIEVPLFNRVKNYSMFDDLYPLPSLFVVPEHTSAASGSATCALDLSKLISYLSSEFGIENLDIEKLKQQTLSDLATYRESYVPKLIKDPALTPILKHFDEQYEKLIKGL